MNKEINSMLLINKKLSYRQSEVMSDEISRYSEISPRSSFEMTWITKQQVCCKLINEQKNFAKNGQNSWMSLNDQDHFNF